MCKETGRIMNIHNGLNFSVFHKSNSEDLQPEEFTKNAQAHGAGAMAQWVGNVLAMPVWGLQSGPPAATK